MTRERRRQTQPDQPPTGSWRPSRFQPHALTVPGDRLSPCRACFKARGTRRTLAAALLLALAVIAGTPWATGAGASIPPGSVGAGPVGSSTVALVFAGGPGPNTGLFVSLLRSLYVPATFFFSGSRATRFSQEVLAATRARDEIGSATYSYMDVESLSTPQVISQIVRGQTALARISGTTPTWFQPPYGDVDARITSIVASLRLRPVVWTVNSNDLTSASETGIVQAVTSHVTNGSIILFHDSGTDVGLTLPAVHRVISALKYRGYRFGTLDQMFGLAPLPACVPNPTGRFEAGGIHKAAGPIFQFWLNHLCRGILFGPATSPVARGKHGVLTQNFAGTGRQIRYDPRRRSYKVTLMWSWGAKIFAGKKVKPRFGDPITHSWFERYFSGTDEGAALTAEKRYGRVTVQQFVHAWAVESPSHSVAWPASVDLKRLRK